MKVMLLGIAFELISGLICWGKGDMILLMYISAGVGGGSLILSGITSGVLSDNIYRRTFSEVKEERVKRMNYARNFLFFSIAPMAVFLIILLN